MNAIELAIKMITEMAPAIRKQVERYAEYKKKTLIEYGPIGKLFDRNHSNAINPIITEEARFIRAKEKFDISDQLSDILYDRIFSHLDEGNGGDFYECSKFRLVRTWYEKKYDVTFEATELRYDSFFGVTARSSSGEEMEFLFPLLGEAFAEVAAKHALFEIYSDHFAGQSKDTDQGYPHNITNNITHNISHSVTNNTIHSNHNDGQANTNNSSQGDMTGLPLIAQEDMPLMLAALKMLHENRAIVTTTENINLLAENMSEFKVIEVAKRSLLSVTEVIWYLALHTARKKVSKKDIETSLIVELMKKLFLLIGKQEASAGKYINGFRADLMQRDNDLEKYPLRNKVRTTTDITPSSKCYVDDLRAIINSASVIISSDANSEIHVNQD